MRFGLQGTHCTYGARSHSFQNNFLPRPIVAVSPVLEVHALARRLTSLETLCGLLAKADRLMRYDVLLSYQIRLFETAYLDVKFQS